MAAPQISVHRSIRRLHGGLFVLLVLIFVVAVQRPLWHTDLWGHLAWGRLILEQGRIPPTEPLLPLARGVPVVDSAWLSQVLGAVVVLIGGPRPLQGLYGGLIVAISLAWLWAVRQRVPSALWCGAGLIAYLWLDEFQLCVLRPQLAGVLCFLVLLGLVLSRQPFRGETFCVALLFALWANLHGSFAVGVGLLGACLLGRIIDVGRRVRQFQHVSVDWQVRRFACWLAVSAIACCLNPYGAGLVTEVWRFSSNPNLAALTEWQPLRWGENAGPGFLVVSTALVGVYCTTPRRIAAWELLVLAGLGLATLARARMMTWWSPVAIALLVLHGRAVWRGRVWPTLRKLPPRARMGLAATGIAMGIVLPATLASRARPQTSQATGAVVSSFTPVAATAWLHAHPPAGLVFNTFEWGDYLIWAGPPKLQVFVNSHAHVVPLGVWQDYLRILNHREGWQGLLDHYGVAAVMVDPLNRATLIDELRRDPQWQLSYEDPVAVIFLRNPPPQ